MKKRKIIINRKYRRKNQWNGQELRIKCLLLEFILLVVFWKHTWLDVCITNWFVVLDFIRRRRQLWIIDRGWRLKISSVNTTPESLRDLRPWSIDFKYGSERERVTKK